MSVVDCEVERLNGRCFFVNSKRLLMPILRSLRFCRNHFPFSSESFATSGGSEEDRCMSASWSEVRCARRLRRPSVAVEVVRWTTAESELEVMVRTA